MFAPRLDIHFESPHTNLREASEEFQQFHESCIDEVAGFHDFSRILTDIFYSVAVEISRIKVQIDRVVFLEYSCEAKVLILMIEVAK